jgi:hypothetical protein
MKKFLKTILIGSIAVFGAGILFISPTQAQPLPSLVVQFETAPLPLFQEVNFLPGEGVIRWVKVTNNSSETQKIGVKVTGSSDCTADFCLSDKLNLVISKEGSQLYADSLTNFYNAGEILLSQLANGAMAWYDFGITLLPETGNDYQGLSTNFNFDIGFFGGESISSEIPPGGGGSILFVLTISKERVAEVGSDYAVITWETNLNATSRVIYSAFDEPRSFDPNLPPNYGYRHSNTENPAKIIFHSMTITGLKPATTYYFRCVSHTSPDEAISTQLSFTTKGVAGAETEKEEGGEGGEGIPPVGEGVEPAIEGATTVEEEPIVMPAPEVITGFFPNLLANIGDIFKGFGITCYPNFPWWIILIFGAYPLLTSILNQNREKKIKTKWLWIFSIIIILILFLIWLILKCLYIWIIAIAILIYLFIVDFLKKRK